MIARSRQKDERGVFFGTAALFSLALMLGGLGPHAPLFSGVIEAAAFPLLVAVALFGRTPPTTRSDWIAPTLFLLLLLAIGLAQLVPLPGSIWRALPQRDVSLAVLDSLGEPVRAQAISLAWEDTRLALQAWLPPIAIFLATMMATRAERGWLALAIVGAATLSSVLGLLQLSFGDGTFFLDPGGISNRYPGLFANYNHQAVFLAAAVALLPALRWGESRRSGAWRWWPAAFWALALIGTLITASRAGLALFACSSLVAAFGMVRVNSSFRRTFGGDRRRSVALILLSVAALALVGWFVLGGYRAELMSARFGASATDMRYEFWGTSLAAAMSFFPYGAGFGSFEAAYQLVEPLEGVHNYVVNHAHNDYLELVIEAGAAGILLIGLFVAWYATRVVRLARIQGKVEPLAWSGVTIIALVMLHSLVDYPLRTEAIGCVFAYACALLLAPPGETGPHRRLATAKLQGIAA